MHVLFYNFNKINSLASSSCGPCVVLSHVMGHVSALCGVTGSLHEVLLDHLFPAAPQPRGMREAIVVCITLCGVGFFLSCLFLMGLCSHICKVCRHTQIKCMLGRRRLGHVLDIVFATHRALTLLNFIVFCAMQGCLECVLA